MIDTQKQTIIAELARLNSEVNGSNLAMARAYFALGKHILDGAERLGMMQTHLMNDAGIHNRRGERAVKFYRALRDDEGGFSLDKYHEGAHEVRARVQNGTVRARFDGDGNPSITAMDRVVGNRPQSSPKEPLSRGAKGENPLGTNPISPLSRGDEPYRGRVLPTPADGLAALLLEDEGNEELAERIRRGAGTQDAESATDGRPRLVIGSQPDLPYALVETERKLAAVVQQAQQQLADGALEQADADAILGSLNNTLQITTNITNANTQRAVS